MFGFEFQKSPTVFFCRLLLPFFFLFLLVRIAFLLVYGGEFEALSMSQISYAMLKGAWFFDSSITLVFIGIPFLITYFPFRWCVSSLYLKLISWYAFFIFFSFALIAIGDLIYFGMVHRHAGHELAAAMITSAEAMVNMIISAYWLYILGLMLLMLLASTWWYKRMMPAQDTQHLKLGWVRLPFFVVMFLIILLVMRGGIESKPIQSVFAYNEGSMSLGHLTLNGVFAVAHSLEKFQLLTPTFMSKEEAESIIQDLYASKHETFPDKDYPLMRERTSIFIAEKKLNVVVLLLESWDPDFIDITRELDGKKPYNVTPNYNELAKKGRLYTNFYANGQRSIDGIGSLITGLPRAPGAGGLGEGIETNNMGWLGSIAKKQGYQTSFLSGSHRSSFYMDKIAPLAGFDAYYGSEDLTTNLHPDAPESYWGGWDYDLLMTGHQLFEKSKQPFLSVLFSVTTHTPWTLPGKRWQKFSGNTDNDKFLNTMFYTDWVLGQFFKAVQESSYADNTVFMLVADHASGNMAHPNMKEQYRVPLLMIGPNIKPGIDKTLGSQIDLIPTIIDLAGWKSLYASLGTSLMEQRENRSVIFSRDSMMGRIEKGTVVVRNLERVVYSEGDEINLPKVEKRLKAQLQVLIDSLQHNRLIRLQGNQ